MALDFQKNASNYLDYGNGGFNPILNGRAKIVVSVWMNADTYDATPSTGNLNTIWRANITTDLLGVRLGIDGTGGASKLRIATRSVDSDTQQIKTGTTNIGTGVWTQVGAEFNFSGKTMTPIVNGAAENAGGAAFGSNTYTAGTPTVPDRIGASDTTPPVTANMFDGRMAEFAIWGLSASDPSFSTEEWVSLARGYSPLCVRPSRLIFYQPFTSRSTTPGDRIAALFGTINGTLNYDDHVRVIMPTQRKLNGLRTATRELSFTTSLARTVASQRVGQVNRSLPVKRSATTARVAARAFAAIIGRTAGVDVNLPDLFQIAVAATVARTAAVSLTVFQNTRKFIGSAGLILSQKRRWDRRPRRR